MVGCGWGCVDVGCGEDFWCVWVDWVLFVWIFWWDVLVGDDCYVVVVLFWFVDCWWVDDCVGCDGVGVDYGFVGWFVMWFWYGDGVDYLWFGCCGWIVWMGDGDVWWLYYGMCVGWFDFLGFCLFLYVGFVGCDFVYWLKGWLVVGYFW